MRAFSVVSRVLWMAFYRRHAVPLGIFAFFLIGLVKPPYLLFSGLFIRSLLLNPVPAYFVGATCLLWSVYSTWSMKRALRHPENAFLVNLGAMKGHTLFGIGAFNVLMAGLPGLGYVFLMAYHAFTVSLPSAWIFSAGFVLAWVSLGWLLSRDMANPRGPASSWKLLPSFRLTYFRLLCEMLWRSSRSALLIVKGFSLLFVALLVGSEIENVLPQIATLAFVVSGLLQAVLTLLLRKEEITRLAWAKGLPIPVWKRIFGHVSLQTALQLPELSLLALGVWQQQASFLLVGAYFLAVMGTQVLALGLTYLPQMTMQDFFRMLFAVFIASFFCLIFQFPIVVLHLAMIATGLWVATYWMFRVDDKLE